MGYSRPMTSCSTTGFARPQHLDIHGEKALLEVKNVLTTGTIRVVGRATRLVFHSHQTKYDIKHTSIEVAIFPYDKQRGPFSASSGCLLAVAARSTRQT